MHIPEEIIRIIIATKYPDLSSIDVAIQKNHERCCKHLSLDPVEEYEKALQKLYAEEEYLIK